MIDSTQTRVTVYRYDPFGNTISSRGTLASANKYRFSSKELMTASSLYYYGYRFYDPNNQRWLNRDPYGEAGFEVVRFSEPIIEGDGPNPYTFVRNDPINATDARGLWFQRKCNPTEEYKCRVECYNKGKVYVSCEKHRYRNYVGQYEEPPNKIVVVYNVYEYTKCDCKDPPPPFCQNRNLPPNVVIGPWQPR